VNKYGPFGHASHRELILFRENRALPSGNQLGSNTLPGTALGETIMLKLPVRGYGVLLAIVIGLLLVTPARSQTGPLIVGLDAGTNPFVIVNPDGSLTGFNIDLVTEVAKRLGRPGIKVVDQQFSGIFAGLDGKRYEFIAAPVTLTKERSSHMLFVQGYLDTNYQFLVRSDGADITTLDDLKGKTIAVNNGSAYDTWLTQNADKYGFKVERYGKTGDAYQAVLARRADAAMSDDGNARYAATKNHQFKPSYLIKTGAVFSWAFRKDDDATRRQVDQILKCMKLDGTVARIFKTWFGEDPDPSSASVTVRAGYGQPGMDDFEPVYDTPKCG
jgi:polar amino acid transport system substrate-binding protein